MQAIKNYLTRSSSEAIPQSQDIAEGELKEDELAAEEEKRLLKALEICRDYLLHEKLSGRIEITSSLLAFGNVVSGTVDGASWIGHEKSCDDILEKRSSENGEIDEMQKVLCQWLKRTIDNLERRARVYKDKSYQKDFNLSSTFTVNVAGLAGFSVQIGATLTSLLAAAAINDRKLEEKVNNLEIWERKVKENREVENEKPAELSDGKTANERKEIELKTRHTSQGRHKQHKSKPKSGASTAKQEEVVGLELDKENSKENQNKAAPTALQLENPTKPGTQDHVNQAKLKGDEQEDARNRKILAENREDGKW